MPSLNDDRFAFGLKRNDDVVDLGTSGGDREKTQEDSE